MKTVDFLVENVVRFGGNSGDYNEQPIYVLTNNRALTGNDFIALYRIRSSFNEAESGSLGLTIGTTGTMTSVTGAKGLYPESITADTNTSTANGNQYTISTVMNKGNRLDVIVNDADLPAGDLSLTGLQSLNDLNYIGTGIRPVPDTLATDGSTGKAQVLLYTYNREELSSSLTSIVDRSGNELLGEIKGTASGDATSGTVTGWSYGASDGGFRFDGASWVESASSSLFNASGQANGYSVMTHAKFAATSNSSLLTIGGSATEVLAIKEKDGVIELTMGAQTLTAGPVDLGKWFHVGVVVESTSASTSGATIYLNGFSASFSAAMNFFPVVNSDTRLIIGKDIGLVASGLTGSISNTRIFNRTLSAQEVALNYFATIPSYIIADSLKIG